MPHPCVVCGRSRMNPNNREEEYMFFGFPVNYEDRCKQWLEFCCREDLYRLTKKQLLQRMVCSKHFEKRDFLNEYQDRLNCTGVPTIYDPTQSLYNITCVLCGKFRKDPSPANYDGTTFHHFPGEEFRCLKWLDFVGVDSYYRLTRKEILYCYICSNHFDKSQFMNGYKARLIDNAAPNIRCPNEENESETGIDCSKEVKPFQNNERVKKNEPLSNAILESQACAACGRSRSDPRNRLEKYKFHPFPAYEIGRCLRWCQFLGREDLLKMSPNQIRKLVLCSKHFLSGQSFHKIGPCDAVPTIKEVTDSCTEENTAIDDQIEHEENEDDDCTMKTTKQQIFHRPLVSSKKPKVDNKPTPLAKKRGRGRRSTSINIPKLDNLNAENRVRKLPIPATNWKIHFANNQFQPLTITNNANVTNTITADGKKLILPFTGDISNLGAPIPVHSLSSMPPGFLIKINLPEQERNKPVIESRRQSKRKRTVKKKVTNAGVPREKKVTKPRRTRKKVVKTKDVETKVFEKTEEFLPPENHDDKQNLITICKQEIVEENIEEEMVPDDIEVLDHEFVNLDDTYIPRDDDDQIHVYEEVTSIEPATEHREIPKMKKLKQRNERPAITSTARRTLLPIRTEVQHFLQKLKPHMSKLPRKAKAQMKLSIVNLVIDRL